MNIPLAYVFATGVGFFVRQWFVPALVVGYWLTNVLGFVLLHAGGVDVVANPSEEPRPYGRRAIAIDVAMSIGYTVIVLALVHFGVLQFPDGVLP